MKEDKPIGKAPHSKAFGPSARECDTLKKDVEEAQKARRALGTIVANTAGRTT